MAFPIFSAIKLVTQVGGHIFKNRQRTKMLMSDAQLKHAEKMSTGQLEYSGKLLEARQSDWKDEFILILLSLPILMLGWAVYSDDPSAMDKMKLFFDYDVSTGKGMVKILVFLGTIAAACIGFFQFK
jgi:hypothetical protein